MESLHSEPLQKRNPFDRLIKWIRSHITLRLAWCVLSVAILFYIIYSVLYHETYWVQLGATLLSMFLVYLIMITSNKELREVTEQQIMTFAENLQSVREELKNLSQGIASLSSIMKEVYMAILESTVISKATLTKLEEEKRKRREMIKPQLSMRVELRGSQLWFFDWRHYHLLIWNSGSDAIGTIVRIGNVEYGPYNISTRNQIDIDIGHINNFPGISLLNVTILVRDVDRNLYQANVQASLPQHQWLPIPLAET